MPKYAVITHDTIVYTTDTEYGAVEYAVKNNPNAINLPFVSVIELKNDNKYSAGKYILSDVRTAQLFEKIQNIQHGYIYNSVTFDLKLLNQWSIHMIDVPLIKQYSHEDELKIEHRLPEVEPRIEHSLPGDKHNLSEIVQLVESKVESMDESKVESMDESKVESMDESKVKPMDESKVGRAGKVRVDKNNKIKNNKISKKTTHLQAESLHLHPVAQTIKIIDTNIDNTSIRMCEIPVITHHNNSNELILPRVSLDTIASFSQILSISSSYNRQRKKIEMIINHNIVTGHLTDDNIIILSDSDKNNESWQRCYPSCFLSGMPDDDILYYLNTQTSESNVAHINKLVIFDNCLSHKIIEKQQFKNFITNAMARRIYIIIMTHEPDVIISNIFDSFDAIMLHTFTLDWEQYVSLKFIKSHPILMDQTTLDNYMIQCVQRDACVIIDRYIEPWVGMF